MFSSMPVNSPARRRHRALRARHALAMAAAALLGTAAAPPAQAAICTWNPATGNWASALNWTCGIVPTNGAADTAIIGAGLTSIVNDQQSPGVFRNVRNLSNAGTLQIDAFGFTLGSGGSSTNTGAINVGGVSTATLQVLHNINNAGGSINVGNGSTVSLSGAVITGGTVNTTGTGVLVPTASNANLLSGVSFNGGINMSANSILRVSSGLTLNGDIALNANSVLAFAGNQTLGGNGNIVLGNTGSSNRALSLEGATVLTLGSGITVSGQSGTLGQTYLAGGAQSIINNGRIAANVSGGSFSLEPNGGVTNNGVLEAQNGGTLVLNANVSGGPAGSIVAGTGSTVLQNGVTLSGNISTSGSGSFRASASNSNVLSGVSFSGTLDLASANAVQRVTGGLVLNGTVNVNSNSVLAFNGTQTLSGAGTVVLGNTGPSNRGLSLESNTVLTLGPDIVVRGQNGVLGETYLSGGTQSIVNNGRISADVLGGTVTLAPNAGTTNNGILEAQNGGTLVLASNVAGTAGGSIRAGAGSTVLQSGVTLSGTIATQGGGNIRPTASNSNVLAGVSFNGALDMATGNAIERVTGGLVLNGSINLNANSVLSFTGDQTLSGNGTITLGGTGSSNRALSLEGATVLTLGSGILVQGENGTLGQTYLAGGVQSIVNNGRISANVNNGNLNLVPNAGIVNNGVLEAANGGRLTLSSHVVGAAGSSIVAGAGSTVVQNGVTLSGTINTTGSGNFRATADNANFLNGVSFNGTLDLASANAVERVTGGLTLNGRIDLNANSVLSFSGDQSLSGSGELVLGGTGASNRALSLEGATVLTLGANIVVRGENGTLGQTYLAGGTQAIVNNGRISANVSGGTLTLAPNAGTTNNGVLEAQSGGTLVLSSNVTGTPAGQIRAGAGSTVVQNGVTLSGVINTSGDGNFRPTADNNNILSGVSFSGVLNMASTNGVERVAGGLTLNGRIDLNANSVLSFNGSQTLGGTGSIVLGNSGASNRALSLEGATTLTIGPDITVRGTSGILGQTYLAGGSQSIVNNGSFISDGGGLITVAPGTAFVNNGLARAQSGSLTVAAPLSGTGTLQADPSGQLNLPNGAKAQGRLVLTGAGANIALGTGNLTISSDYTNVAAGSGNGFNRRAGVTGTGQIFAAGNVAPLITGAGVSGGATANATLAIGNVRVGTTVFNYQINNGGSTGPTLRGAIQTSVNGASLNDPRLGGTGVTPGLFNAGAPGFGSGDLGVSFSVASSGAIAPLTGQLLNFRSNFENIGDQKLNIVVSSGAAAYNAAVGSATPAPIQLAAQRVGGSVTQALTITNTAPAGAFSEDLNAQFGPATGAALGAGSVTGVLAGGSSGGSGSLAVGVDTTVSGVRSGSVTVNFATAGAVGGVANGLGVAAANQQVIAVSGNVYAPAVAQLNTPAVNFGIVRVGDTVAPRNVSVTNTASGALTDTLRASLSGGASPFTASGTATAVAAGATNASSLAVTLNTAAAGVYSSSGSVSFTSQNPEMADLPLGTASVGFTAQVNNLAATTLAHTGAGSFSGSALSYTLNFGTVLTGAAGGTATLSLANSATGPADALAGSFNLGGLLAGDPFALGGFASFSNLAAGSSLNGLTVSFGGTVEGSFDRVIVLNRLSTNGSGPDLSLAPVELRLVGTVTAVPEPGTWAMWLAGLAMLGSLLRRRTRMLQA